jgi:hypothetical protein
MITRRSVAVGSLAAVVAAGGFAVSSAAWSHDGSDAGGREAVRRYAAAVRGPAREGGRIVVVEIRPALRDLVAGTMTPAEFREAAVGWKESLSAIRRRFAAAPAPAQLRHASELFDTALRRYLLAVDAFVAASARPATELETTVAAAAVVAENADRIYDQADALLQAELYRLGLPHRPPFPTGDGG